MQYKIPQDVQRADTIIGPITFMQLAILLVGGGIDYAIYLSLANTYYWYVWAIPVVVVALITLAVAFLKISDMTFTRYVLYMYEFVTKPRERYWKKNDGEFFFPITKNVSLGSNTPVEESSEDSMLEKQKKFKELTNILDK